MIILTVQDQDLVFEHSLVSLSEWESHYEKAFFSPKKDDEKTIEEMEKYFEVMLTSDISKRHLVKELDDLQKLRLVEYINQSRSATIVKEMPGKKGPNENVTSELIYYWMIAFKIPFKPSDEWHLNRLLMLIKICGVKMAPPTKRSKADLAKSYRDLNEQRRREMGTKG